LQLSQFCLFMAGDRDQAVLPCAILAAGIVALGASGGAARARGGLAALGVSVRLRVLRL
jgi:hypothetical protein